MMVLDGVSENIPIFDEKIQVSTLYVINYAQNIVPTVTNLTTTIQIKVINSSQNRCGLTCEFIRVQPNTTIPQLCEY